MQLSQTAKKWNQPFHTFFIKGIFPKAGSENYGVLKVKHVSYQCFTKKKKKRNLYDPEKPPELFESSKILFLIVYFILFCFWN